MIRALFYLRLTSLANWFLQRVGRLRRPKYLIGSLAGAAYVWFFFLRASPIDDDAVGAFMPLTTTAIAVAAVGIGRLIIAWLAPEKPGLAFTEAEIAFLFPAPATRRMLVHYKLLSSQLTILISSVMIALVGTRWPGLEGNFLTHLLGWWVAASILSLHSVGAALTNARLNEGGVRPAVRQAVVIAIIIALLGAALGAVWQLAASGALPQGAAATPHAYLRALSGLDWFRWVIFPARLVLEPFFAPDWKTFAVALPPAVLVAMAHYFWVMRSEVSFEEGSIAAAEKRARRIAALHAGKFPLYEMRQRMRAAPFPLNPGGGFPEIGFLWKNLLSTRSFFKPRTFYYCAGSLIVGCALLASGGPAGRSFLGAAGAVSTVLFAYTILLGPQLARQDLRGDLLNADLLKSYPLPGWRIVLGQILAPAAILTGILWLCVIPEAFALATRARPLPTTLIATGAACVAIVAPVLCLLQLMIPNAGVLLFPAWAQAGRTKERGLDMLGQRLIFVFGQLLVVLVALLPAAFFGVLLAFALNWILPTTLALALGAGVVFVILALEIAAGLLWLGRQFERFDLSVETIA